MMEEKYSFFNAALRDGHVMSTPIYEPVLEFVPSMLHEIQSINPEFCWVQLIFRQYDEMMAHLLRVKGDLHDYMIYAETQDTNDRVERREKNTEWYRTAKKRIDKIDKMRSSTAVILGMQGMLAGSPASAAVSKLSSFFSSCTDEIDTLRLFEYKDPRMLRELVKRRIVIEKLQAYFKNYNTVTREEPPALVLTQKEIPYYVHLPSKEEDVSKFSLKPGAADSKSSRKEGEKGTVTLGGDHPSSAADAHVCEIQMIPVSEEQLDEARTARLAHIPSPMHSRSIEIIYRDEAFRFLLSSECKNDLTVFQQTLSSIYKPMNFISANPVPEYVRTIVVEDFRNEMKEKLGKKDKAGLEFGRK